MIFKSESWIFRFLVVVIVEPSYGFKPDGMGQLHMASAVKKLFGLKFYFEIIVVRNKISI